MYSQNINPTQPQMQSWLWGRSAESDMVEGKCITTDKLGNVYVAGIYYGKNLSHSIEFGEGVYLCCFNSCEGNPSDIFLAKYDPNGKPIWGISISSLGMDEPTGITADEKGYIYLTGNYNGKDLLVSDRITFHNNGSSNIFVAKFTPAGNTIWVRQAKDTANIRSTGIVHSKNGLYLSGYYWGSGQYLGVLGLPNDTNNQENAFIARMDDNGNYLWAKSTGGWMNERATAVTADSLDNAYICGHFNSASIQLDSIQLNRVGNNQNIFTAKYDNNGSLLWAKSAGINSGLIEANGISCEPNGLTHVVGNYWGSSFALSGMTINNFDVSGLSSDIFYLNRDANGNANALKNFGSNGDDNCTTISTISGTTFIAGSFAGPVYYDGLRSLPNRTLATESMGGNDDLFVTKLYKNGSSIITLSTGNNEKTAINGVKADPSGAAYVTGYFNHEQIVLGKDTLNDHWKGGCNMFAAKLGTTTLITTTTTIGNALLVQSFGNEKNYRIFPKPFKNGLCIEPSIDNEPYNILITDLTGRICFNASNYSGNQVLNLIELNSGVYFLTITNCGIKSTSKIIKE